MKPVYQTIDDRAQNRAAPATGVMFADRVGEPTDERPGDHREGAVDHGHRHPRQPASRQTEVLRRTPAIAEQHEHESANREQHRRQRRSRPCNGVVAVLMDVRFAAFATGDVARNQLKAKTRSSTDLWWRDPDDLQVASAGQVIGEIKEKGRQRAMTCAPANDAWTRPATRPRIESGNRSAMIAKLIEPMTPPKMPVTIQPRARTGRREAAAERADDETGGRGRAGAPAIERSAKPPAMSGAPASARGPRHDAPELLRRDVQLVEQNRAERRQDHEVEDDRELQERAQRDDEDLIATELLFPRRPATLARRYDATRRRGVAGVLWRAS